MDEIRTIDPSSGKPLDTYPFDRPEKVERTLSRAAAAQRSWGAAPLEHRADVLRAIAARLLSAREEIAELITAEMGKPIAEARAEVEKCAWACDHYAARGSEYLSAIPIDTGWRQSYVQFPPLGVVLAIMPWNYPFWQVIRAAAPALLAGNVVVLKHASNVTGCALLLERLLADVEGARDLLGVIVVPGADVASLIADRRVASVTLTGSEAVGISVATVCARHLKKSVLELGGSDPFIVLEDADVAEAAATAVAARFQNAGQSCIAAKRFLVVDTVADEFEERLAGGAAGLVVGDPRDAGTDMGPMSRADLRDELADHVRRGVAAGGRLLTGGVVDPRPGAYFPPTVMRGVAPGTPLFDEETFGPVAAITRAASAEHAIELANASRFGLSSSLWTADVERARRLAARIDAGGVFINAMTASDPRMPFGGVKRSGWGRELGAWGIREFVNCQAVSVAPAPAAPTTMMSGHVDVPD